MENIGGNEKLLLGSTHILTPSSLRGNGIKYGHKIHFFFLRWSSYLPKLNSFIIMRSRRLTLQFWLSLELEFILFKEIKWFLNSFEMFNIYFIRLTIIVSLPFFSFSQNNCHFRIPMQHLLLFFHYYTLIYWILSNLTTPLTTINKGILVNDINFTIEINIINHFLSNHSQTLSDYNLGVL